MTMPCVTMSGPITVRSDKHESRFYGLAKSAPRFHIQVNETGAPVKPGHVHRGGQAFRVGPLGKLIPLTKFGKPIVPLWER